MAVLQAPAQIYLKPGDIYAGEEPAIISTLLGSCVAVTMFVPRLKAGAICRHPAPLQGRKAVYERRLLP